MLSQRREIWLEPVDRPAIRMVARVPRRDHRRFRLGRLDGHAVSETSDQCKRIALAVGLRTEREREEHVRATTRRERRGEIERRREHADDSDRFAIENDRAPDNRAIARKAALPELVAE